MGYSYHVGNKPNGKSYGAITAQRENLMKMTMTPQNNYLHALERQYCAAFGPGWQANHFIVRPLVTDDCDLLCAMHQRLSDQTRYSRFLRPYVPTTTLF